MHILALDTSTVVQSVGVFTEGADAVEHTCRAGRGHTETLLGTIDEVLRGAGLTPFELELVVVGTGPGSFTGLRTGMAAAKALCLATGCAAVGVGSLEAMACGAHRGPGDLLATITDARKGEVFAALWQVDENGNPRPVLAPRTFLPERLVEHLRSLGRPLVAMGNGLDLIDLALVGCTPSLSIEVLENEKWWPGARALAELGRRRYLEEGPVPIHHLEPCYLRLSDAELNWNKRQ